jgi:hypothetical protein
MATSLTFTAFALAVIGAPSSTTFVARCRMMLSFTPH